MANQKNKNKKSNMTFANLKAQENNYYTTRLVVLDENNEYYMDEKFRLTKIYEVIEEYKVHSFYAQENGLVFDMFLTMYMLIIKNFTNIPVPDSYEDIMSMANTLTNLNYFEKILNEFDQEEFNRVMEIYKQSIENAKVINEQLNTQIKQVNEQLEREKLEKEQSKQNSKEVTTNA
jgi:hypothetical protein